MSPPRAQASRAGAAPSGCVRELTAARDSGDATRSRRAENALCTELLPLAFALARGYRRHGTDIEDLRQIASVGLVKAVRAWQPAKGPLLGYVVPTVRGEIKRYFRDNGAMIRIPRSLYEAQPAVAAARRALRQRLGREPSIDEVAHATQLPTGRVREAEASQGACHPLSADAHDGIVATLASGAAQAAMSAVDLRAVLRPAMAVLTPRERRILALRFVWGQSQSQIAGALGLSQMHISRLLATSLRTLREILDQPGGVVTGAA